MSEQSDAYPRVWESFRRTHRLADGRHDTQDWRSRSGVFAVCLIRVPSAILEPELGQCQAELAQLPDVRVHPNHFLHISLQELGFVTDRPTRPDEITPAMLEEFVGMAAPPISEREPYAVSLGEVNSFQDAAFLEVHDDEQSSRLHQRLYEISAVQSGAQYSYLPHVTIAHYTASRPADLIIGTLSRWRTTEFGTFLATEVEVATLTTDEPYPPFEPYAVIPLAG